jgi:hypothetical protein
MTKILHPLAADAREIDRLRDEAERLARDIARRHPRMLALACARADVVEALADAEFAGWMDDVDAQDAA